MGKESDLWSLGFRKCSAVARSLNIYHPDPGGLGPFCRLCVEDTAPERPGVYAWGVNGNVMYFGHATQLRQITQGARMGRAYNDYTYMPPSKVLQVSSPRVRLNGQLNCAVADGLPVSWWWLETASVLEAIRLEAELIRRWNPPWNRTSPSAFQMQNFEKYVHDRLGGSDEPGSDIFSQGDDDEGDEPETQRA